MLIGHASEVLHRELGWAQLPLRLTGCMGERWTPESKLSTVGKEGGGIKAIYWVGVADAAGFRMCHWLSIKSTYGTLPAGFL